jgi:hypothetical protein
MTAAVRAKGRPGRLSARVTADEKATVDQLAQEAGLTTSEYCRKAIVGATAFSAEGRVLLAEQCRTQQLLLGLVAALLPGNEEVLKRETAAADARKFAIADGRIHAARGQS